MESSAVLVSLVDKLSHHIPDIRDRSMRAISRKLLSPLSSPQQLDMIARIPAGAQMILQWINDRYDQVQNQNLDECLDAVLVLASMSDATRRALLEAGAVAFFEEFSAHNLGYRDKAERIVNALLFAYSGSKLADSTPSPQITVERIEKCTQPPIILKRVVPHFELRPSDEQELFDLAVRLKFSTANTSISSIYEMTRSVRFGLCMHIPAGAFADRPSLVEALCCQLAYQTPSLVPIRDCEEVAVALESLVERMGEYISSVGTILAASVESIDKRPELLIHAHQLILSILSRLRTDQEPGYVMNHISVMDAESLVRPLARVVAELFARTSYQAERFTFADGSSVSLRRLIEWTDRHRIVAELVIELVHAIACTDTHVVFKSGVNIELLAHIGDWVSDDEFYRSTNRPKRLASIASSALMVVAPEDQADFSRARELLLAVKREASTDHHLTDRDLSDIFTVWRKVPALLSCGQDRLAFVKRITLACEDSSQTLQRVLGSERELADAFVQLVKEGSGINCMNNPEVMAELVATINCSNPSSFIDHLMATSDIGSTLPLFSRDALIDTSIHSLVRSLFSSSEATRKQASLVLWNSLESPGKRIFVPDPLSGCSAGSASALEQYKVGSIPVDTEEVVHAISVITSSRLGLDVRTASAVQACTLLASADPSIIVPSNVVMDLLESLPRSLECAELAVAVCHLVVLLRSSIDGEILHDFLPDISLGLYSEHESVNAAAMLVLSRVVFDKPSVLGSLASKRPDLYCPLLRRLGSLGFNLLGLENEAHPYSVQRRVEHRPEPSNRALAICVSLSSVGDKPIDASDILGPITAMELSVIAGRSVLARPDHDFVARLVHAVESVPKANSPDTVEQACMRYVVSNLRPTVRLIRHLTTRPESSDVLRILAEAVISAGQSVIRASTVTAMPPWFICELADANVHAFTAAWKREGTVPDSVSVFAWTALVSESGNMVRRKSLGVLVALAELGSSMAGLSQVLIESVQLIATPACDDYTRQAVLWLLLSCPSEEWLVLTSNVEMDKIVSSVFRNTSIGSNQSRAVAWRILRKRLSMLLSNSMWESAIAILSDHPQRDSLVVSEVCLCVSEMVLMDDSRISQVIDILSSDALLTNTLSDTLFSAFAAVVTAVASKRGREVAKILMHNDKWKWLIESANSPACAAATVRIAVGCVDNDPRLIIYLTHSGLFSAASRITVDELDESLVRLISAVGDIVATESSPVNHFKPVSDWLASQSFTDTLIAALGEKRELVYQFVDTIASFLLAYESFAMPHGTKLVNALMSLDPPILLSLSGCAALTQLLRVPGVGDSRMDSRDMIDLMKFHDSVLVPDGLSISASEGSALFFAQMRVISAWTAAAGPAMSLAYADWFCSVWKRAIAISSTKQTSSLPLVTELICGLIEVIATADLSLQCWGPPLSQVLSHVTRPDIEFSPQLFSLCLSVAEAASSVLVRKAVTARVIGALIAMHAMIHGKNVPKDQAALSRAASVVRLGATMTGCRLTGDELLKNVDGWLEAKSVFDSEVLIRLVASLILAGGHVRRAMVACEPAISFLAESKKNSISARSAQIAELVLTVIAATSVKSSQVIEEVVATSGA